MTTPEDFSNQNDAFDKEALEYFQQQGIDVNVKPTEDFTVDSNTLKPAFSEEDVAAKGITTHPCLISIKSFVFYTFCKVTVPTIGKTFKGHSGGLGVGRVNAGGVIYYADLSRLLKIRDFGVFFVAKSGGTCHVTWGTHGNATAVGVGIGVGAFGGRGDWK